MILQVAGSKVNSSKAFRGPLLRQPVTGAPGPTTPTGLIWGSALGIGRKPLIWELKYSLLCAPSLTTKSRAPLFPLWLLTAFSSDHPQMVS